MEKLLHERLREMADGCDCEEPRKSLGYEVEDAPGKRECAWCSKCALESMADEIERDYLALPRDPDGKPWKIGDPCIAFGREGEIAGFDGGSFINVLFRDDDEFAWAYSHNVKRPIPKVYDVDGVEIKVGDTVWHIATNNEFIVESLPVDDRTNLLLRGNVGAIGEITTSWYAPHEVTHERPVFDAEGVRICKGDTVYTKNGESAEVVSIHDENEWPTLGGKAGKPFVRYAGDGWNFADEVSHREPDSLEKLRDFASEWANPDNVSNSSAGDFRDAMQEVTDRLTALIERDAK